MTATPDLTRREAHAIVREDMQDKTWQDTSLGGDAAAYLRAKRRRLTGSSYLDYEAALAWFCWHFEGLELDGFEPPVGTERVELFLDRKYGSLSPRTYNKNLSIIRDFFKWHRRRETMHGDPTLNIDRAKARGVHREIYSNDDVHAIFAENPDRRDRIALRLLLTYALRRSELKAVRFSHFDHQRRLLTVFGKGGRVEPVPIPDPAFWLDLERLLLDLGAAPTDHLLPKRAGNHKRITLRPALQMTHTSITKWWYECLWRAGVVPAGVTEGAPMHRARHTAGQRLLEKTGNLKAVQMLLRHASIVTTGDVYTGWDVEHLAESLALVEYDG